MFFWTILNAASSIELMDELTISISWEYFLGLLTGILALMVSAFCGILTVAWYASSKFSKIETSIEWMKSAMNDLKTASDNAGSPAFSSQSPVNLNSRGEEWLDASGLKKYLDENQNRFMNVCEDQRRTSPYDVQQCIFQYFDIVEFEPEIEKKLKEFAFSKGTTMNIMRRIAAIYFRNLCLNEFGMKTEDIDIHDPEKTVNKKI